MTKWKTFKPPDNTRTKLAEKECRMTLCGVAYHYINLSTFLQQEKKRASNSVN